MQIININGPINAGKTTVCGLLEKRLPACLFIEVDDLLADAEQEALRLDFMGGIKERLNRLEQRINTEKQAGKYQLILFAYPMEKNNYRSWKKFEDEQTSFMNITLAPALETCLTNRGSRELDEWEKSRIVRMYAEGYQCPRHSDLVIDNTFQRPEETVEIIMNFLKGHLQARTNCLTNFSQPQYFPFE